MTAVIDMHIFKIDFDFRFNQQICIIVRNKLSINKNDNFSVKVFALYMVLKNYLNNKVKLYSLNGTSAYNLCSAFRNLRKVQ